MESDQKPKEPRTREFARIERESGTHPATKALHRKPRGARSGVETREYTRIERGHEV